MSLRPAELRDRLGPVDHLVPAIVSPPQSAVMRADAHRGRFIQLLSPPPFSRSSSHTSAGAVVRVQQVTIATGTVVASNVVVTEMVTEQIFIGLVSALVHIWRTDRHASLPVHMFILSLLLFIGNRK